LWDTVEGLEVRRWAASNWAQTLTFSADGKRLLSTDWVGKTPGARIWEIATGRELLALGPSGERIALAGLSPDGQVVSVSDQGVIRRWDAATGKEVEAGRRLWAEQESRLALSPDGNVLAAGSGLGDCLLYDVPARKELRLIHKKEPENRAESIALSDKHVLTTGSKLHFVELATGKEIWTADRECYFDHLAFSVTGRLVAAAGRDSAQVFESVSGAEVARFGMPGSDVLSVALSPDGRELACGYEDSTILLWDLTGQGRAAKGRRPRLDHEESEARWRDLASADARAGYRAVWRLLASPNEAISFLGERLCPAKVPVGKIEAWMHDLDSADFGVREKAQQALESVGEQAAPALRKTLAGDPSPEVRRRVGRLLNALVSPTRQRRECRALEVLEYTRTPEGRRLLGHLAKEVPGGFLGEEAKAALVRLSRRP
jgi:hypothetical protein